VLSFQDLHYHIGFGLGEGPTLSYFDTISYLGFKAGGVVRMDVGLTLLKSFILRCFLFKLAHNYHGVIHLVADHGTAEDLAADRKGTMEGTLWIVALLFRRCYVQSDIPHNFHLVLCILLLILFSGCEIKTEPATLALCPSGRVKVRLAFFFGMRQTL